MVGKRQALVKRKASRKGLFAAAAAVGTGLLFVAVTPWLGLAGLAGTAVLTYDWLRYRGKWGLRF